MATKSVIDIDVNSEQLKAVAELFDKYQKAVNAHNKQIKQLNDGWGAVGKSVKGAIQPVTNFLHGIEKINQQFRAAESSTQKLVVGLKVADRTATSISKTAFNISSSVARTSISLTKWAGFGLAGGLLGAGGGLFGLSSLAGGAGGLRRQAQGIGVGGGELESARNVYGRIADVNSLLGNIAESQSDITRQGAFFRSGINPNQNPVDIMAQALEKAGQIYRQNPAQAAQMLQASGLSDLGINTEIARRASAYKKEDLKQMRDSYQQNLKQFNITDKMLKSWQDLDVQLDLAGKSIKYDFLNALEKLTGPLSNLSKSFASIFDAAAKNPNIQQWISGLASSLQEWASSWNPEATKKAVDDFITSVSNLAEKFGSIVDAIYNKMVSLGLIDTPQQTWVKQHPDWQNWQNELEQGTIPMLAKPGQAPSDFIANVERDKKLPKGMLDKIWGIESGRRTMNVPDSSAGAQGPLQLKPLIQHAYGVTNPQDFYQEGNAAGDFLHYLLKKYNGDVEKTVAAFNQGETKVDLAIGLWGSQWKEHIKEEGKKYLKKYNAPASSSTSQMVPAWNNTSIALSIQANRLPSNTQVSVLQGGGYYTTAALGIGA